MPKIDEFLKLCRVTPGKSISLKDHDPAWAGDKSIPKDRRKKSAKDLLSEDTTALSRAQELLYASNSWSILVIFQAMDAAGKDGTIKHVMSGVNPQGVQVYSFKHPSAEELGHDFLWRCAKVLPERGRIGIFNRSYYEEVLIVKVHPELAEAERVPSGKSDESIWEDRYRSINAFEHHLARNGTLVLKFFLHLSKGEQRKRFLDRINDPEKQWKFSPTDLVERGYWDDYMEAYECAINATSTEWAPWYVIPADHKWVCRSLVASALTRAIESLELEYPKVSDELRLQIDDAKKELEEK